MATRKTGSRSRQSTAGNTGNAGSDAAKAIGDSAQKIWLAGLGAFERARAEGPRMFDTLVEQGRSLGGQAREAADQALRNLRDSAGAAGGRFDKLEQVFEDRVSKSLGRLGLVTRGEVADLNQGVRDLADEMREFMSRPQGGARAASKTRSGAKRAAGKARKAVRKTKKRAKSAARR